MKGDQVNEYHITTWSTLPLSHFLWFQSKGKKKRGEREKGKRPPSQINSSLESFSLISTSALFALFQFSIHQTVLLNLTFLPPFWLNRVKSVNTGSPADHVLEAKKHNWNWEKGDAVPLEEDGFRVECFWNGFWFQLNQNSLFPSCTQSLPTADNTVSNGQYLTHILWLSYYGLSLDPHGPEFMKKVWKLFISFLMTVATVKLNEHQHLHFQERISDPRSMNFEQDDVNHKLEDYFPLFNAVSSTRFQLIKKL